MQENLTSASLLESFPQGALIIDRDRFAIGWNRKFLSVVALADDSFEGRLRFDDLLARIADDTLLPQSAADLADYLSSVADATSGMRLQIERRDGRRFDVSSRPVTAEMEGDHQFWLVLFDDVTAILEEQARAAWRLDHDDLTALPNRRGFTARLSELLVKRERNGGLAAIFRLDLTRFKAVNDNLGHAVGDRLLRSVAGRLQSMIRPDDIAARFSADEFGILLTGLDNPIQVRSIAERMTDIVGRPYLVQGHAVTIGVGIGIALIGIDGDGTETLIKAADLALARAKKDGPGVLRFFGPEMDHDMRRRRLLENDMRAALPRREFDLHFQPLFDLTSNRIVGFESLLRWRSPEHGPVSPADFIPLAEEIGLIVPIGEWVLKTACRTAAGWPEDIVVAVNLSPAQFKNPTLAQAVEKALAIAGLAPHRLQLEITESVLMNDSDAILRILHHFRSLGIRLAMDDFGTGYSSLSYLRSFPFDKIKIDQSFVRDSLHDEDSAAIVRAISSLGHSLGMRITAEGVETAEQMRRVRADGCQEVQGYLIGRPVPQDQIAALLENTEHHAA